MNIGVDIDGVLTNDFMDFGIKMCVEENLPIDINIEEYNESKVFNWTKEQTKMFWDKYFEKYAKECNPRTFVSEITQKLQEEGNKIYIITARGENLCNGQMRKITENWLKFHNIKYEKLILTSDSEKISKCLENDVRVMIEDSPQNIQKISGKIKVIKFDCQYNREVNGENIITAYSWYHIYKIIKEMKGDLKWQKY